MILDRFHIIISAEECNVFLPPGFASQSSFFYNATCNFKAGPCKTTAISNAKGENTHVHDILYIMNLHLHHWTVGLVPNEYLYVFFQVFTHLDRSIMLTTVNTRSKW